MRITTDPGPLRASNDLRSGRTCGQEGAIYRRTVQL